jgi:hypothetical protein
MIGKLEGRQNSAALAPLKFGEGGGAFIQCVGVRELVVGGGVRKERRWDKLVRW